MKPWLGITLCAGCLAAAACRSNHYRTAVEQESRQWEDRFYVTQDRLEECQNRLEATLQRNAQLEGAAAGCSSGTFVRPEISKPSGRMTPPSIEGVSPERFQASPPPSLEPRRPGSAGSAAGNVETPYHSLPESTTPDSVAPPFEPQPSGQTPQDYRRRDSQPALPEAPRFEPPQRQLPPSDEPRRLDDAAVPEPDADTAPAPSERDIHDDTPLSLSRDSRAVSRVAILALASDGFDADDHGGDDGIQFVLQPRDGDGRVVKAPGEISVVLVEPRPDGKSRRVARWDMTARQASGYLDRSPHGFHLRLPWPASQPERPRLQLFVRYTTADGRRLQSQKAVTINLHDNPPPINAERSAPPASSRVAATPQPQRLAAEPSQSRAPRRRPVWSPRRP